jgi:hypothetical protein
LVKKARKFAPRSEVDGRATGEISVDEWKKVIEALEQAEIGGKLELKCNVSDMAKSVVSSANPP